MSVANLAHRDGDSTIDAPAHKIAHQPALDGLRGLAVLLVLLFHDGLLRVPPSGLHGGFVGVDVFFVLSGYLITSLLLAEHASTGRVKLGSFWARRARRLLPAVLLLLLGIALYSATIAVPSDLSQIRGDAIATLFYVQNWHQIIAVFPPGSGSVLDHTWSLSVEEQWYFVWPALLALLLTWKRLRPSRVLAIILAMAAASAAWTYALHENGLQLRHVYYGTDVRAQELLVGAALAVLLRNHVARSVRTRVGIEVGGLVGCVVVGATVLFSKSGSAFFANGGYAIFSVAVAAVIAAAVQTPGRIVRPVLSASPLRALGLISYGLYLYHWPIYFWLSSQRLHMSGINLSVVRILTSIVVATASFVLVERPIRRGALQGLWLRIAAPLSIVVVLVTVVVTTDSPSPALVTSTTFTNLQRAGLAPGRRVLVVGHGLAFQIEVAGGRYTKGGVNAVATALLDCSFIPGDSDVSGVGLAPQAPHCNQLLPTLGRLRTAFRPDVIVLMPGSQELFDRRVGGFVYRVGTPPWTTYATAQLDGVLGALKGSDQIPVLLTNVPCSAAPKGNNPFDAVSYNAERHLAISQFLSRYADAHFPTVRIADLAGLLCPGGNPIRTAAGHEIVDAHGTLTPAGAQYLWDWIARQLAS